MLVLARKVEQEVLIRVPGRDKPIIVSLLSIGRSSAALGFAADKDIEIMRKELVEGGEEVRPHGRGRT